MLWLNLFHVTLFLTCPKAFSTAISKELLVSRCPARVRAVSKRTLFWKSVTLPACDPDRRNLQYLKHAGVEAMILPRVVQVDMYSCYNI